MSFVTEIKRIQLSVDARMEKIVRNAVLDLEGSLVE